MLIEPSPEQFTEWLQGVISLYPNHAKGFIAGEVSRLAYRAGADMELEECLGEIKRLEWFCQPTLRLNELRAARRPKPLSLKKQACDALDAYVYGNPDHNDKQNTYNIIRRALESLPDNTSDEGTSYCALAEQHQDKLDRLIEQDRAASVEARPAPASSLVERMLDAIRKGIAAPYGPADEPARAAIRELAAWLRDRGNHCAWVAQVLEMEANR